MGVTSQILLEFHNHYQAVFPTVSQSFTSISDPFKLPTRGVKRMPISDNFSKLKVGTVTPASYNFFGFRQKYKEKQSYQIITGFNGIDFSYIMSNWHNTDNEEKKGIIIEALRNWHHVWDEERKYKSKFEKLFYEFTEDLFKHSEGSDHDNDRQMSQGNVFFESLIKLYERYLFKTDFIALPMFFMKFWDLVQSPAQQEEAANEDRFGQRRRAYAYAAPMVVSILINSQRDDLGRLKRQYFMPLLQAVYRKISDMPLDCLFDAYERFTFQVVPSIIFSDYSSLSINKEHLSVLQKSFVDLLARCSVHMEQEEDNCRRASCWFMASRIAGQQGNSLFLQQYKDKLHMGEFTSHVPRLLASDVWKDLPAESRQSLFCSAVHSDDNLEFIRCHMNDEAIDKDENIKGKAYKTASEQKKHVLGFVNGSTTYFWKERAPKIAELLKQWKSQPE